MSAVIDNRVAEHLAHARYEVLPFGDIEEAVLEHVPIDVTLTVTVSPRKGIEHTLDLAARLTNHGYSVVPHLSARLVRDLDHLREILARIDEMGAHDVFVVAGDADEPAGAFEGAAPLLEAMAELGHQFEEVGITGYPESHPLIPDETTIQAMFDKARFATYIVSQICFDSAVTLDWIERVWARGTRLPIYVGIPGAVPRTKLMRVSTSIGLGASMRFLRRHRSWVSQAVRPGGFSPDPLIEGIGRGLADPERKIAGFHIFTFNDVADTEVWRTRRMAAAAPTL
ncbi:MAG TPA: methylenetetrahydrofolate reductase [Gaiellaceae bacterium]|nr:methylenetetrahydrofolate reductase [Gaiellaceae bacterium]